MRSLKLFFFFFFLTSGLFAQTITLSGTITDSSGHAIPFASIYIKSTTISTTANSQGNYKLVLNPGKHEIISKALSYKQDERVIDVQNSQTLNIVLLPDAYELQSVTIRGSQDPAYRIIRNAIRERKTHLQEIESYTCDVYIKGLQKMLAAPEKFLGTDMNKIAREIGLDSNRTGIFYLSESESRLNFIRPDKTHEEMIASKISGRNRAFSFNRASDMRFNFYENLVEWNDISNRPMVSPIADNALFYYNYRLIGTSQDGGETIHKIQVIPKRDADPVFRGTIYILENSWRIHSVNLYLTKQANIKIDTLKIEQQFFPVTDKMWMPSSVKFDFSAGLFGFKIGGYYIAIYKNYALNPELDKKGFIEALRITNEVNQKDSLYWLQNRPLPLTEEEKTDYYKKGLLAIKRESKPYMDSLDKVNNRFKVQSFIIGNGYNVRRRYKKENYHFSSLLNSTFYNTVEGFGISYDVSYNKLVDSLQNGRLNLSGNARYGFASEKFHGSLRATIPFKSVNYSFYAGSNVLDLNNQGTLTQLENTVRSLIREKNQLKLYEKEFVQIGLNRRISAGLTGNIAIEWAERKWLSNISNYTFKDREDREFTSNNPFTPTADFPLFPENQSFRISTRLSYEFSKQYITYPTGKRYLPSKYPRLDLSYIKGINHVLGSDVDYDQVAADIFKSNINLKLYGKSSFYIGAGKFLNSNKLYYTDYKHFARIQSLDLESKINSFLFLDYYLYSTPDRYFEGHLEHNFSGFILNKVPLIRKLKLQEIVGTNYLSTPSLKNYSEVYFGFKYLFIYGFYGISFENNKRLHSGFTLSYRLGSL